MKVRRGDMVETWGPHSNGHMEQFGFITHVYGAGDEVGVPVNLHCVVDLGGVLIANEVPVYPSRQHAMAALASQGLTNSGAMVCWPREQDE